MRLLEALLGLALVAVLLRDVFDTVVVPGRTRGLLQVTRRVAFGSLRVWHRTHRKPIGTGFAPFVLLASFVGWMLMLVFAFGLVAHAAADSFSPPLKGLGDAMYVVGAAMTTIGSSAIDARGVARVVIVGAGFSGLIVVTMGVTYLLQVQGNIGVRDTTVLKIDTLAGEPPSALALLERHAALDYRERLPELMERGRDWCAAVLQSHASHPSLIYFRSAGTRSGWPSTLGTLIDLALLAETLLDEPRLRGPAILLREEAQRLAHNLVHLLQLEMHEARPEAAEVKRLCERLATAGYRVRAEADLDAFRRQRGACAGGAATLSEHLGAPPAPLVPGASA